MAHTVQITPRMLVFPSRSMAYNAGAIIHQGQALLIDPGVHPDEIDAIAWAVAERGAVISAILLTHSHWDHILGPERLPPAPIIAQAAYRKVVANRGDDILHKVARWERRSEHTRAAPFAIPLPTLVFDSEYELRLGDAKLRLIHIPGHAADQAALFDPADGTLWAADCLSDLEIPFVSDSLVAYEATLARLAALPIHTIVPGHGSPTSDPGEIAARLDADQAYLAELRALVQPVVARGGAAAAALAACAAMRFRIPDENTGPHRLNVESAFIELGGDASRDTIGWAQKGLFDE